MFLVRELFRNDLEQVLAIAKHLVVALAALAVFAAASALASDEETEGVGPRRTHGIEILADWQPLPDVAARASSAAGNEIDIEVDAWGDTARGCYLTVQSLSIPGAKPDERLHDSLRAELTAGGVTIPSSAETSDEPTESSFAFEADTLRGNVRTLADEIDGSLRTVTAACFYEPRQSDWCAARCAELINQLEVTP